MAFSTATDSTTIGDVIQIFQGYNVNDSFQTVLDNEVSFERICNTVLRAIFRCAFQTNPLRHSKSLPKKHRIQKIAAEEGVSQESPSTPEHTITSETSPSEQNVTQERVHQTPEFITNSEQNVTQERIQTPEDITTSETPHQTPERTTTSETSLSEQNATQEPPSTPEHATTSEIDQNSTQERIETPQSTSPTEFSISDDALRAERISFSGDASTPKTLISDSRPTLDSTLDSAIELSDASPPLSSHQAERSATIEQTDSGVELLVYLSAATERNQTNLRHQAIAKVQTIIPETPYADRLTTKQMSPWFHLWVKRPREEFWERLSNTIGLKNEGDASTRLKAFIQDAITKRSRVNIQILQYRFTSILVYQSFQKMMNTNLITSSLTRQYLELIDMPPESEPDCTLLLYSGRNRIEFDRQIAPDREEIDHGPQLLVDLNDNQWDYINNSRMRAKAKATVAQLKAEDITSWSERSGAQSAAKEILLYGQELLDLVDFQTKYNRAKGQKRQFDSVGQSSSSNVYSRDKRIRAGVQDGRPNESQNRTTPQPSSPAVPQPNLQNSSAVSSNIFLPMAMNSPGNGRQTENFEEIGYREELYFRPFERLGDQGGRSDNLTFERMGYSTPNFLGMGYSDEWYESFSNPIV
ncbi:hypothetical protein V8C35DRAFT_232333 [Trichoderma chlorosporum]